jgi:predicted ATPase
MSSMRVPRASLCLDASTASGRLREAEGRLQQALDVSRRQEARMLELRAATSLGRLWRGQGRNEEARGLVAEVYGWFAEGFDTPDLRDAQALL